ncbi:MAG: NADH-quinone oxidoreductase subunit M [Verrucomicrobia subdivision 3 bacterium]|nr:NADH-quinone oxidoreductase subunit M [Verrucomicrobiota bacterium]MCC6820936.1 NADH-quinone oxidoreductase subunit M [Limisphaerales bacterium]
MKGIPILTILTLLPLFAGIIVAGLGEQRKLARGIAFGSSLLSLALALLLWRSFDAANGQLNQFIEQHQWIPSLGIQYFVAVDGLGLLMVLLTAIITPMAMLASWNIADQADRRGGQDAQARGSNGYGSHLFFALVLFLQAGLFGTFTALNFFHWFIFWELSLIPAFFLVRLWGGSQRAPAATQFFIYTMVGSVAMLLAFLAIFLATGKFDFTALAELGRTGTLASALSAKLGWYSLNTGALTLIIFGGILLGFAVKVPLMPFHTWLPATYAEAPSGVTMLLTGVMSKMGVYGFIRILLPIFGVQLGEPRVQTVLLSLAVITIVFSACAAFAQRDLKRMLAYSSINHLGYCLLGIFAVAKFIGPDADLATQKAAALNGVFLQMFNHGLTAATLFWFVALIEKRSGGLRGLNDFGGLRKVAPIFCGLMGIALFSSLGLPGLNGFVGEFLIFKGVFPLAMCSASLSVIGLLVTAIFILTILQRVFNGPLNEKWAKFPDLSPGEIGLLLIPIVLMFVLGLYPRLVLDVINPTVVQMVEQLKF